jgi:hypothetical protein
MPKRTLFATAALAALACGGEKAADTQPGPPPVTNDLAEYRKSQKAYADSVLNAASSARQVADRLGANYDVGPLKMRDSIAALATKANCFAVGRGVDPYLAGTVTFWVNMGAIGTDVIRVQESKWTTQAGNAVDGCLNKAAAAWKFDPAFASPKAYLVQLQFKQDSAPPVKPAR